MPSTPLEAKGLLTAAIRDPDPVIFLEPTRSYRLFKEEVPDGEYVMPAQQAPPGEGRARTSRSSAGAP